MATDAIDQTIGSGAATAVTAEAIDAWLEAGEGLDVLLFAGRGKGRPEGHDAAVALREMRRAYGPAFRFGVVADADEDALARRFGVVVWPSVVFLAGGAPLERLARMRDWSDYAGAFRRYLGAPPAHAAH